MFRSTMFLQFAILILAVAPTIFLVLTSPFLVKGEVDGGYDWVLISIYLSMIPFWIALYQGFKLLRLIDSQLVFTPMAVQYLRRIKYAAIIIAGVYIFASPYIFMVANKDDAPGVVLINLILIGAALVVATFAAVLQQLFRSASLIKNENDLTV